MATHTPAVCWLLLAVAVVALLWSENFEVGKVFVVFVAVDVVDLEGAWQPCAETERLCYSRCRS